MSRFRTGLPRSAGVFALFALWAVPSAPAAVGDELIFAHDFEASETSHWSSVVTPCPSGVSRYPHLQPVAPITPCVIDRMQVVVATNIFPSNDVFLKTGASGSLSSSFLSCFADSGALLDLDGRVALQSTIDFFLAGDAAGVTPFERSSLAVGVGRSASWAIAGAPAPLAQETTAIDPRMALVDFGTNDMQLGATYAAAMPNFYSSMHQLLDELESGGIVPIITGLNPRADSAAAAAWVPTYDVVTRGIAEQRQLPYLSLYQSMSGLPDMGLLADGIHGNTYNPGSGLEPCLFTSAALQFNYNLRNLRTLELLDAVRRSGLADEPSTAVPEAWSGTGAPGDPFLVDRLPFTHAADTSVSPHDAVDAYPNCGGGGASGPELWYRLVIDTPTAIRIAVLDRGAVDVDLFLISGAPDPSGCLEAAAGVIERTLAPGTYHLALDTETSLAGPYLLAILECEAGDADCL